METMRAGTALARERGVRAVDTQASPAEKLALFVVLLLAAVGLLNGLLSALVVYLGISAERIPLVVFMEFLVHQGVL